MKSFIFLPSYLSRPQLFDCTRETSLLFSQSRQVKEHKNSLFQPKMSSKNHKMKKNFEKWSSSRCSNNNWKINKKSKQIENNIFIWQVRLSRCAVVHWTRWALWEYTTECYWTWQHAPLNLCFTRPFWYMSIEIEFALIWTKKRVNLKRWL